MPQNLATIAREIRKDVLRMHRTGSNVGSAMSVVDILVALYFDVLRIAAPDDPARDRFVLSKGHAAAALYATLAQRGWFERSRLVEFLQDGSPLTGHPTLGGVAGVEVSTGSLGHGLPIAVGLALGSGDRPRPFRIFVLMGCGEMQEGSVWEGLMLASRLGLDRIVAIVDANNLQGYERTENIQPISGLPAKLTAFGWSVREADGHNLEELGRVLGDVPFEPGKPSALIAHTLMGKGVSEMEDRLEWHYFNVSDEKLDRFLAELDGET